MDLVSLVDPDKNLSEYPDPAGKDGLSGKLYAKSAHF
jgi:hypothetical protein